MIDLKQLRERADEAGDFHRPLAMNPMVVIELLDRLEKAEKKIKKYGKGSEALCKAFGVE